MAPILVLKILFSTNVTSPDIQGNVNWASEANPTLGCSIEISRDIYIRLFTWVSVKYDEIFHE